MSHNVEMAEPISVDESSNKIQQQNEDDEQHRQCIDELRNIFLRVNNYRQEPIKYKDELSQLHARGMHLCNKLRSLNRAGRLRIQKARELTSEHRNRLDDQTLEQQNLLYELSHINKEISRCEEFKSKDQQLELVSLDDFYANAPPELTDRNITANDPHRLHLFQLDWELMQREKLHEDCKALQTEINDLKKQIVRRRKRLRSLRPKLKQVVKSTDPVRRYIESQFDDTNNVSQSMNNPLINKLPDPLYVLYSLVLAYQQCDGRHITCQIESKEDSTIGNSSMEINSDGIFLNNDPQQQSLMRPHPLHVKLTLILSPDHTGELIFTFLPQLSIVTVQGKLSGLKSQQSQTLTSTLLHNLLDDNDNGQLSPNPTTDFLFQQQGKSSPIFSETNVGFPYHWIQQLCKCQMVPLQRQELVTDCSDIIKRLTQRMRARIALDKILINLEKYEMPLLAEGQETTSIINSSLRYSYSNQVTFRSWREISYDDISKYDFIQIIINENLIDRTTTAIYECKFQSLSHGDNNKITLHGYVFIPANYPQAKSIILLKLLLMNGNKTIERTRINSENIKIMERSLLSDVVYSPTTTSGSGIVDLSQHFTLLAQQIWRLSIGFPSLINAESNPTCTSRRRQTLSRLID